MERYPLSQLAQATNKNTGILKNKCGMVSAEKVCGPA